MELLADLRDLVLPVDCVGCGAPGRALCRECERGCGRTPGRRDPDPRPAGLPPVHVAGAYDGVLRTAVLEHKEHGERALTAPLGAALAAAVADAVPVGPVVLVPVPTTRSAVSARGDDTVLLLARAAARLLRRRRRSVRVRRALRTGRRRRDQAGLSAADRARNVRHAFAPRRAAGRLPPGAAVVVVDDVVTSGATALAAVTALRTAGVRVVAVAACAGTVRLRGRPAVER